MKYNKTIIYIPKEILESILTDWKLNFVNKLFKNIKNYV